MHTIQLRNVSDEIYQRLTDEAKRSHRSLSGHVLHLLETAVSGNTFPYAETLYKEIAMVRENIGQKYGEGPSSVDGIRQDRSR